MTRRKNWLRHPPRIVGQQTCPTGLTRFATKDDLLPMGVRSRGQDVWPCTICRGYHTEPPAA